MALNPATIASLTGKTNDAALVEQIAAAASELERLLGYPLCGAAEAEERIFTYKPGYIWQRVHPLYGAPTAIVLVRGGVETTITDYQLGQNGELHGSWFNMFRMCDCKLTSCACDKQCDYIKVTAKWGFASPETVEEVEYCTLPSDLMQLIGEAVKQNTDANRDIQSENVGTRSYGKFARSNQSVWQRYEGVVNHYKLKRPRF